MKSVYARYLPVGSNSASFTACVWSLSKIVVSRGQLSISIQPSTTQQSVYGCWTISLSPPGDHANG